MPQDIGNIQRDLANLQKSIKDLTEKAKREQDPKRKAELQKKIIDLNEKRSELDKAMEDAVADMDAGVGLEIEGFTKWNKYRKTNMKKLTEAEKKQVRDYAKKLVETKLDAFDLSNKIINYLQDGGYLKKQKSQQLVHDIRQIIEKNK